MRSESSSRSITDDAPPPPLSVLVLLDYVMDNYDQNFIIRQVETQQEDDRNELVCFKKPMERQGHSIRWSFALPTCSTGVLYMFPSCSAPRDKPLRSYKFDFRTGFLRKINPPHSKANGYAVNLGERIYFLERPSSSTNSVFECYDPTLATWKALKPFPDPPLSCRINATAVWGEDTILFNIASLSLNNSSFRMGVGVGSRDIWAYSVIREEWYVVVVKDSACCRMIGQAVFVNDTIYALTDLRCNLVLALSIERKQKEDGNIVFKCSLQSNILLTAFEEVLPNEKAWNRSMHLVHLEENRFCIVDSCEPKHFMGYQPIQLSYMNLDGEKMSKIGGCVHQLKIEGMDHCFALHCFPLPKGMTTALKGKALAGKGYVFNLDPYTYNEDKSDGEGVYVRNVPRNATAEHLEKLKKFGPIKKEGIRIWKYKKGRCLAYVEFESATSKQRAIEASTIQIGHLTAEISEKPPRTLGIEVPVGKN